MTHRTKVFARIPKPTQKSYRDAVAAIIVSIQAEHDLTDQELADRLSCSVGTIRNARNKLADLNGVTLANIEREFGPSALDPFLALGGSRAVPLAPDADIVMSAPLELAEVLHKLIEAQSPLSEGGVDITDGELERILPEMRDARTALDALIGRAERRSAAALQRAGDRLRSVGS